MIKISAMVQLSHNHASQMMMIHQSVVDQVNMSMFREQTIKLIQMSHASDAAYQDISSHSAEEIQNTQVAYIMSQIPNVVGYYSIQHLQ